MKQKWIAAIILLAMPHLVLAKPRLPVEIHQPASSQIVKIKHDREDDFLRVKLLVRGSNVYRLTQNVQSTARQYGYRMVGKEISTDEADLSFQSKRHRLNVSIDLNSDNTMDYEVERELN